MNQRKVMMEDDWQKFKPIRELALQRFCEHVMQETQGALNNKSKSAHERYLSVSKLLQEEDAAMGRIFDNSSRSTAIYQLIGMIERGLVTLSDLATLSADVRDEIQTWLKKANQ